MNNFPPSPPLPLNITKWDPSQELTFASNKPPEGIAESMAFLVINFDKSYLGKVGSCADSGCTCGSDEVTLIFPSPDQCGIKPGDAYQITLNGQVVTEGPVV